ncbi:MAG: hypothetical protein AAFY63_20560, partial [Cyanobacteria bacterium J06643_13]
GNKLNASCPIAFFVEFFSHSIYNCRASANVSIAQFFKEDILGLSQILNVDLDNQMRHVNLPTASQDR